MFPQDFLSAEFPILDQTINGRPLVYLDNAATTQKPLAVLQASRHYYEAVNANIHRGTYYLARLATETFENHIGILSRRRHSDRVAAFCQPGQIVPCRAGFQYGAGGSGHDGLWFANLR